jgi:glycine betaine/choline ABC-type transport system substrate-binding protein
MNSIAEIKSGLHHYIAETDDVTTLTKLQKFVEELLFQEDKIIAIKSDGTHLNQSAYKMDIDEAIKSAERGEVISIDEMERELNSRSSRN